MSNQGNYQPLYNNDYNQGNNYQNQGNYNYQGNNNYQPNNNNNYDYNQSKGNNQPLYPIINQPQNVQHHQDHHDDGEKFPENRRFRDAFFFILFILHLAAIIALFIFAETDGKTLAPSDNIWDQLASLSGDELRNAFYIILSVSGVGAVFAALWLILMRSMPKALIYISIFFGLGVSVAVAVIAFMYGQVILGVVLCFVALLNLIFFILVRRRIPFAVVMLKTICSVIDEFPTTIVTAFVFLPLQLGWCFLWARTFMLAQQYQVLQGWLSVVLLLISFFWTTQVLKNVVHVTVSGVFATWYFFAPAQRPRYPTLQSLKRATTTSFGSICLGSLLVAVLKTIKALIESARRSGRNNLLTCFLDCIVSCIDNLVRYFNLYAFTQVAIYGKTYCQAAKATWKLFLDRGFTAIINDDLISGVLTLGCFIGSVLTAVVGYFMTVNLLPDQFIVAFAVLGFLIGFVMVSLTMEVVESGVACVFVCFAEDTTPLQQLKPELYEKFRSTYNLI
eukprot:TRINITY_DN5213_c0_g1_i1.p1 TRINITY_DN5213_c0_g1~~TRINITY_DN5213_c0_g1_i1.p1  ORF type:complete len:505 (+),score=126.71 TRINITY_DN5213_c0_g1_i1:195-1709(+)